MKQTSINKIGFTLISFGNIFGLATMLSAAFDLLAQISQDQSYDINSTTTTAMTGAAVSNEEKLNSSSASINQTIPSPPMPCNSSSTSLILLIGAMPGLFIKLIYPILLINLKTSVKVSIAVAFHCMSYSLLASPLTTEALVFVGVALTSIASGLADPTILSMFPRYSEKAFEGYAIGVGIASFVSSLFYAIVKMFVSIKTIMLLLFAMPIILVITYAKVIKQTCPIVNILNCDDDNQVKKSVDDQQIFTIINIKKHSFKSNKQLSDSNCDKQQTNKINLKRRLYLLTKLSKYMIPLFATYLCTTFNNLGVSELLHFDNDKDEISDNTSNDITTLLPYLDQAARFRWLMFTYCLGELIARSMNSAIRFSYVWLLPSIQVVISMSLACHAFYIIHIPNFYLVLLAILLSGYLAGLCFTNVYKELSINYNNEDQDKECAIAIVSISDALAALPAVLLSMISHRSVCS